MKSISNFIERISEVIKEYFVAIIIGAILLYFFDVKFFLIYLFIVLLSASDAILERFGAPNYLQIKNDRLIRMIIRHLKIGHDEKLKILKEAQEDMSAEDYDLFKKEIDKV